MELVKLRYVKNFRDLGGVKTVDGRTVKSKMLYRGATLKKLTEKDVKLLKDEYKLSTIIDLRTKKEAEEQPDISVEGVNYIHMPVLTEAAVGVSHEKKVHSFSSLKLMPPMQDMYVNMVKGETLNNVVNIMKKVLSLKDEEYAVLFRCTVGKDRTGILAALILSFLGVDRDTIVCDYLISNRFTRTKAFFVYILLLIIRFNHKFAKKIRFSLLAKQIFIDAALDTLEKDFGSMQEFFKQKLCYTPEEAARIKERFLV